MDFIPREGALHCHCLRPLRFWRAPECHFLCHGHNGNQDVLLFPVMALAENVVTFGYLSKLKWSPVSDSSATVWAVSDSSATVWAMPFYQNLSSKSMGLQEKRALWTLKMYYGVIRRARFECSLFHTCTRILILWNVYILSHTISCLRVNKTITNFLVLHMCKTRNDVIKISP